MPWRGVCPRDIAISAIAALDCAFRRPRRLQPTTLPVAALWMAASYHRVTRASLAKFLSRSLPRLARRPLLAPVTTRSPQSTPLRPPGSDRRHARSRRIRALACATTRVAHRAGRGLRRGPRVNQRAPPPCHRRVARRAPLNSTPKDSVRTSRSRPHGQSFASLPSQRAFVPPMLIDPYVFGRRGGTQSPPQSGPWSTRFEPYRVRAAPQKRLPPLSPRSDQFSEEWPPGLKWFRTPDNATRGIACGSCQRMSVRSIAPCLISSLPRWRARAGSHQGEP